MAARGAGLRHRDLAAHPRSGLLDGLARAQVRRPGRLEVMQDVLRAGRRPQSKKVMVRVLQRAAAANGNEPGIADFGEDHSIAIRYLSGPFIGYIEVVLPSGAID